LNSGVEILVLNSVVDHLDEQTAKRGRFEPHRVSALRLELMRRGQANMRIAVLHHHPLLHSCGLLSDTDVIETGASLLAVLRQGGCGLVVHGHKHYCRLSCADTEFGPLPVMAAGSFAAALSSVDSDSRNLFHVLEAEPQNSIKLPMRGHVYSWEWHYGTGWLPALEQGAGVPHCTGFGFCSSIDELRNAIIRLAPENRNEVVDSHALLKAAPDLSYLNPGEFRCLQAALLQDGLDLSFNHRQMLEMGRPFSSSLSRRRKL
jgi:hypothetical protein